MSGQRFGIATPVAINVDVDGVRGWLDQKVAWAMTELIHETQPDVVVEIGVFAGKSLLVQAAALRDNGKGVIYGIDPWRNEDAVEGLSANDDRELWTNMDLDMVHTECMHAIWERKLDNVVIIRATSRDARPLFVSELIDILYIDGGHSEEVSCKDVEMYLPLVRSFGHGYIWIDDTGWPSLRKATSMLAERCELQKDFGHSQLYRKT